MNVPALSPEEYRDIWHGMYLSQADDDPATAAGRTSYSTEDAALAISDIVHGLGLNLTDSLLDIGCSKGFIGQGLRSLVARYVGLDYIEAFHPTVVGDAVALPFAAACFSKTLMGGVLVCIPPEWNAIALREMRRVTKPGGRGFVSCNPFTWIHPTATIYDRAELVALACECGWSLARTAEINPGLEQAAYYFDMVVE